MDELAIASFAPELKMRNPLQNVTPASGKESFTASPERQARTYDSTGGI